MKRNGKITLSLRLAIVLLHPRTGRHSATFLTRTLLTRRTFPRDIAHRCRANPRCNPRTRERTNKQKKRKSVYVCAHRCERRSDGNVAKSSRFLRPRRTISSGDFPSFVYVRLVRSRRRSPPSSLHATYERASLRSDPREQPSAPSATFAQEPPLVAP